MKLKGKKICLGVTGGIAAYKAAELASSLIKMGAEVFVVMTEHATHFVGPATFRALTHNPVYIEMFDEPKVWDIQHISLAENADLFVIVPATANIIGKIACGIADDLLSTTIMATIAPVIICPAMNVNMYNNKMFQRNLELVKDAGYIIIEPETGRLACGVEAKGRLAATDVIISEIESTLFPYRPLEGKKIIVTAGGTREPIDPVRFISNHSSGKMGYALAEVAANLGAEVYLVSTPTSLTPHPDVKLISVNTALEMRDAVFKLLPDTDAIIKAAAVADYRPVEISDQKIKKNDEFLTLNLVKNPDILAELGKLKEKFILVGFAAETSDILENASQKLERKNLDLIVLNDVTLPGAGFDVDTNIVHIISRDGRVESLPLMDKKEVAQKVMDALLALIKKMS